MCTGKEVCGRVFVNLCGDEQICIRERVVCRKSGGNFVRLFVFSYYKSDSIVVYILMVCKDAKFGKKRDREKERKCKANLK